MKYVISIFLFLLIGCASSEYTQGTYLDTEMVNKIVQGKTTVTEIETIFGKPYTISKDGTNLHYSYFYTVSKSHAQSYVFSMDVKMEGFQRMLTIIFDENNIVEKFNLSETPLKLNSN